MGKKWDAKQCQTSTWTQNSPQFQPMFFFLKRGVPAANPLLRTLRLKEAERCSWISPLINVPSTLAWCLKFHVQKHSTHILHRLPFRNQFSEAWPRPLCKRNMECKRKIARLKLMLEIENMYQMIAILHPCISRHKLYQNVAKMDFCLWIDTIFHQLSRDANVVGTSHQTHSSYDVVLRSSLRSNRCNKASRPTRRPVLSPMATSIKPPTKKHGLWMIMGKQICKNHTNKIWDPSSNGGHLQ